MANVRENYMMRQERKAEKLADAVTDTPIHALRIDGRSLKLVRNQEAWEAAEKGEGLIPWNGNEDNKVDRFDCRLLLDFYREPDARISAMRRRAPEEDELEDRCKFEAMRDLVHVLQLGLTPEEGLVYTERLNVDIRARARQGAMAVVKEVQGNRKGGRGGGGGDHPGAAPHAPHDPGAYAAVGFDYGGGGAGAAMTDNETEELLRVTQADDSQVDAELAVEADVDAMAAREFGIELFSERLEECELEEAGTETQRMIMEMKRRRKIGKRAEMKQLRKLENAAGGGAAAGPAWAQPLDRPGRRSPTYGRHRSRSRSRSRERDRDRGRAAAAAARPVYITEFAAMGGHEGFPSLDPYTEGGVSTSGAGAGRIREALVHDPASLGGALLDENEATRFVPGRSDRDRGYGYGRGGSEYRERDRDRERPGDRGGGGDRDRERDRGGAPGYRSEASKVPAPAPAAAAAAAKKETPQERLKRLMAAQLNKQATKDQVQALQKKKEEEAEMAARNQLGERMGVSAGGGGRDYDRGRDRSDRDGHGRRDRSRERSRERDRDYRRR